MLAACGAQATDDAPGGTVIECALDGAATVSPDCTMERLARGGQSELVVRHPDGAFRRFELGVPGRGIVTADGAEQADVTRADGVVDVRVGSDRYRLPIAD